MAIYRDNSKVGQPLSTSKPIVTDVTEAVEVGPDGIVERIIERVVHQPVRQKLPRTRRGKTFEFRVADCKGFATIGEYDDGQPGEIFLTVSKQGSTMAGVMDAFAKSVSYGLQYGVPLRAFVEAFTNMRFEPAGMTDDPDLRFASSIMDYLFRRLALEYMTYDERAELGIFSVERAAAADAAGRRGGDHGRRARAPSCLPTRSRSRRRASCRRRCSSASPSPRPRTTPLPEASSGRTTPRCACSAAS